MRRKAVGVGGELVRSQLMVSEEEKKEVSCRSLLSHLRKVRQSFFKPKQPVKESHISQAEVCLGIPTVLSHWLWAGQGRLSLGANMVMASISSIRITGFHSCCLCLNSILVTFLVFIFLEWGPSWNGCQGPYWQLLVWISSQWSCSIYWNPLNPGWTSSGLTARLYHHLLNIATPSGHHALPTGLNFLLAPVFGSVLPGIISILGGGFHSSSGSLPCYSIGLWLLIVGARSLGFYFLLCHSPLKFYDIW